VLSLCIVVSALLIVCMTAVVAPHQNTSTTSSDNVAVAASHLSVSRLAPSLERPNIILDLDSTLIFTGRGDAQLRAKFRSHEFRGAGTVYERPHLQPFLDFVFAHFRVSVWTAAEEQYARFVLHKTVLRNLEGRIANFDVFWHRSHYMKSVRDYGQPKSLQMLYDAKPGFHAGNVILIDDMAENGEGVNADNFMLAPPFDARNMNEDAFFRTEAIPELMRYLQAHRYYGSGRAGDY